MLVSVESLKNRDGLKLKLRHSTEDERLAVLTEPNTKLGNKRILNNASKWAENDNKTY